jgi:hypothetical protein
MDTAYPPRIPAAVRSNPLGYMNSRQLDDEGNDRVWTIIDEKYGDLVIDMFIFIAEGGSVSGLRRWLDSVGALTRGGNPFSRPAVVAILRNETYVTHPLPLVTRETYDIVQAILDDPDRQEFQDHGNSPRWLLTNIALCGRCGRKVDKYTVNGRQLYRCYIKGDHTIGRSIPFVDRIVIDRLIAEAPHPRSNRDPIFQLSMIHPDKRLEMFGMWPLLRKRWIIRESLEVRIMPVGKGRSRNPDSIVITRKAIS